MKIVILANEVGDKLWPLATPQCPKSLLPLCNGHSLLIEAINRCLLVCDDPQDIYIVATPESKDQLEDQLEEQGIYSELLMVPRNNVIFIDSGTDLTSVISCVTKEIRAQNDDVVCFIPSDQFYWPDEGFAFHISNAVKGAQTHKDEIMFLTMHPGLPAGNLHYFLPDWPETQTVGMVYNQTGVSDEPDLSTDIVPIKECRNVTDADTAGECIENGWVWDLKTWVATLGAFKKHIKGNDLYLDVIPKLIQKKKMKAIIIGKLVWFMVDNWAALKYLTCDTGIFPLNNDNNLHLIEAFGNMVKKHKDKEVILIGVEDLIIIDTEDKLLITTPGGAFEYL